jgi:hypothetical protein
VDVDSAQQQYTQQDSDRKRNIASVILEEERVHPTLTMKKSRTNPMMSGSVWGLDRRQSMCHGSPQAAPTSLTSWATTSSSLVMKLPTMKVIKSAGLHQQ